MGKKKPAKKRASSEMVFAVSDKGKAYRIVKALEDAPVMGKKLGETIQGDFLGLAGYQLKITGGSDKDGVPMYEDLEGPGRKDLILSKGFGFSGKIRGKKIKKKPRQIEGLRKRKLMRGNTISNLIAQVNLTVAQAGPKPLAEIFPAPEKKEEAAKA
jgi:small subunit ribosomal protein S6e